MNDGLPGLNLKREDVIHFYAGIRPLVDTTPEEVPGAETSGESAKEAEKKDGYNASRAAEVYDHAPEEAIDGLISAIGGKWTTSRHLAEQVVDLTLKKLGREAKCETQCTPVYGGDMAAAEDLCRAPRRRATSTLRPTWWRTSSISTAAASTRFWRRRMNGRANARRC